MMANAPLYPTDQLFQTQLGYNANEIKKFKFPDCIVSYFSYFESWTPGLSGDERKILLNRLLQDDDIAFSIYMENIGESYDVIKARLIETFTECGENLLSSRKEKIRKRKMFKKMSREEMENFVRTTYNELNSLTKERLIIKELTRMMPRKFKKLDLENKASSLDQMIGLMAEKFDKMKLKEKSEKPEKERKQRKLKKLLRRRRHGSSSSSSSSESSDDEKLRKRGHHHDKHHDHHGQKDHGHKDHKEKGLSYY